MRTAICRKIKTRGKRPRKQTRNFDQDGYDSYRPKAETVFSVEMRKMESTVLA